MPQSFREHDRDAVQRELGKAVARYVCREAVKLTVATRNVDHSASRGFFQVRKKRLRHFEWPECIRLKGVHHLLACDCENRNAFIRINSSVVDQHVELTN